MATGNRVERLGEVLRRQPHLGVEDRRTATPCRAPGWRRWRRSRGRPRPRSSSATGSGDAPGGRPGSGTPTASCWPTAGTVRTHERQRGGQRTQRAQPAAPRRGSRQRDSGDAGRATRDSRRIQLQARRPVEPEARCPGRGPPRTPSPTIGTSATPRRSPRRPRRRGRRRRRATAPPPDRAWRSPSPSAEEGSSPTTVATPAGSSARGTTTPPTTRSRTHTRLATASTPSARTVPASSRASATKAQVPSRRNSAAYPRPDAGRLPPEGEPDRADDAATGPARRRAWPRPWRRAGRPGRAWWCRGAAAPRPVGRSRSRWPAR